MVRARVVEIIRAGEWWEYKLVPILAAFYATALMLRVPVVSLWPAALILLLALIPGAAWVSVINDLTDRADDRAAGKPNRLAGSSRLTIGVLLFLTMGAGAFFVVLWRNDGLLVSLYLGAWVAFGLYSLAPFRWKTRGFPGVLADAGGAHLFPTLVAVTVASRAAAGPVDPVWLGAAALWSLGYGVRGILWHQLRDRDHDHVAGVRTFVQRHAPSMALWVGRFTLAVELSGLVVLLWRMQSPLLLVFVALYAVLLTGRRLLWGMRVVLVAPLPRSQLLLQEYYDVFLPIGILVASSLDAPGDLIVLGAHLLLFPRRAGHSVLTAGRLLRDRQKRYSSP
ncbi:MAG TPA: UbiA family prenyltransferase [Thermoanaerobaculia bacterium]|nr:UbiA family prenyltransferase [Thermoanaerobaculia bacterium]